ncbi:hypothetical protein SDC9_11160 [bioreactor metagenome]|uniref:Uncharacterized protein n=1 Tax=bioreactor metagenome TaxID=1076179 RepID=A0A644TEU6_9ZZZZ
MIVKLSLQPLVKGENYVTYVYFWMAVFLFDPSVEFLVGAILSRRVNE